MKLKLFVGGLLLLWTQSVLAQTAFPPTTPVTPTGTLSPQVSVLCWESLAVNTNTTLTCTPPAPSQYGYVTAIYFDVCSNASGPTAINNVTFTSTGLPNTPSWTFSFAGTNSTCQHWGDSGGGAVLMKSSTPGAAFTIVPPAISATNAYNIRVYGYWSP